MSNPSLQIVATRVRRIRRRVVMLLAIIGIGFVGAAQATASCGDYLHHQGMKASDTAGTPLGDSPDKQIPFKKPCHGPSCQQGHQSTPAPAPAVVIEFQDRWMLATHFGQLSLDQSAYLPRLNEHLSLATDVYRLDRPPKA